MQELDSQLLNLVNLFDIIRMVTLDDVIIPVPVPVPAYIHPNIFVHLLCLRSHRYPCVHIATARV